MRSLHSSIEQTAVVQSQHDPIFGLDGATDRPVAPANGIGATKRSQEPGPIPGSEQQEKSRAMAYMTDTRAHGATVSERISQLRGYVAGRLAQRRVFRTTLNELQALNDRELADLGIARGNIPAIAREAANTLG